MFFDPKYLMHKMMKDIVIICSVAGHHREMHPRKPCKGLNMMQKYDKVLAKLWNEEVDARASKSILQYRNPNHCPTSAASFWNL